MLRKIFKKKPATVAPEPVDTFNYLEGPKSDIGGFTPRFIRKSSDWSPEYGLLWVRQNGGEHRYTTIPDVEGDCIRHTNIAMTEQEIVDFMSEAIKRRQKGHLVVLTADAFGMYPTAISVDVQDGKTIVESSCFCTRKNVDCYTASLVQKMLDALNTGINFQNAVSNWHDGRLHIEA